MNLKKTIQSKPYTLLWSWVLVLVILAFIVKEDSLNINFHDTYYVIAKAHIAIVLSVWFLLCGVGYLVVKRLHRKLTYWLTLLHILISVVTSTIVFFPNFFVITSYDNRNRHAYDTIIDENEVLVLAFLIFIASQALYFVNVLRAAVKKPS